MKSFKGHPSHFPNGALELENVPDSLESAAVDLQLTVVKVVRIFKHLVALFVIKHTDC